MDIDPQYAPLPVATRAILREKTLLGEGFVSLSAAQRTGPSLPDGATIPTSHVQPTQSLDQVLATFDRPTQQAFENFLTGTSTALAGRGQALSSAIGTSSPAVTELTAMVGVLNQQQPSLDAVFANSATALRTLGDRAAALRTLITAGGQVFNATAARNLALSATTDALPPFLRRLRVSLAILNSTLHIAKPSLDALEPVAPLVAPALQDLIRLSGPAVRGAQERARRSVRGRPISAGHGPLHRPLPPCGRRAVAGRSGARAGRLPDLAVPSRAGHLDGRPRRRPAGRIERRHPQRAGQVHQGGVDHRQ